MVKALYSSQHSPIHTHIHSHSGGGSYQAMCQLLIGSDTHIHIQTPMEEPSEQFGVQ